MVSGVHTGDLISGTEYKVANTCLITALLAYRNGKYYLTSTNKMVLPCVVTYNSKQYLALRLEGNFPEYHFVVDTNISSLLLTHVESTNVTMVYNGTVV